MSDVQHLSTHNILQRMDCVRQEIGYIRKAKKVESYMAVTHDQVTGELREYLIKHGVLTITNLVSGVPIDTGTKTKTGTPIVRFEGVYDITFCNIDVIGESVTSRMPGHALDHGDKAPGKATSYAAKSALLKAFNIETGENDESRYGSDDEPQTLTADKLIQLLDDIKSADSLDALRARVVDAMTLAAKAHDKSGHAQVKAAGEARAKELGAPLREPAVPVPAAKAPSEQTKATGEKASPGIIKNIIARGKAADLDHAALCRMAQVDLLSELSKEQAGALLKRLAEGDRG